MTKVASCNLTPTFPCPWASHYLLTLTVLSCIQIATQQFLCQQNNPLQFRRATFIPWEASCCVRSGRCPLKSVIYWLRGCLKHFLKHMNFWKKVIKRYWKKVDPCSLYTQSNFSPSVINKARFGRFWIQTRQSSLCYCGRKYRPPLLEKSAGHCNILPKALSAQELINQSRPLTAVSRIEV